MEIWCLRRRRPHIYSKNANDMFCAAAHHIHSVERFKNSCGYRNNASRVSIASMDTFHSIFRSNRREKCTLTRYREFIWEMERCLSNTCVVYRSALHSRLAASCCCSPRLLLGMFLLPSAKTNIFRFELRYRATAAVAVIILLCSTMYFVDVDGGVCRRQFSIQWHIYYWATWKLHPKRAHKIEKWKMQIEERMRAGGGWAREDGTTGRGEIGRILFEWWFARPTIDADRIEFFPVSDSIPYSIESRWKMSGTKWEKAIAIVVALSNMFGEHTHTTTALSQRHEMIHLVALMSCVCVHLASEILKYNICIIFLHSSESFQNQNCHWSLN